SGVFQTGQQRDRRGECGAGRAAARTRHGVRALASAGRLKLVIPAQAGIQLFVAGSHKNWIPACAGMTASRLRAVALYACRSEGATMTPSDANRRPIAARDSGWARAIAARLARTAITPNQISLASVAFAALGGAALIWRPGDASYFLCAACIQLRL